MSTARIRLPPAVRRRRGAVVHLLALVAAATLLQIVVAPRNTVRPQTVGTA